MMRSESFHMQQQILTTNAPKGFSYDVIIPNKSLLNVSPLNEGINSFSSGFNTDADKDMDSTDYSHEKRHDMSSGEDQESGN